MKLFTFVENLALQFPKTKPIAIFISFLILFDVHKAKLFCSGKPIFIGLKIGCGLHHMGAILVLSQANLCRVEFIVLVAQLNLKVSY